MTARRRRGRPRHKGASERAFWLGGGDGIDDVPVIRPPSEPTAMVRSLGAPPLPGGEVAAQHYFTAVYERAAGLAVALAAASGVLDMSTPDDDTDQ